MSLLLFLCQYGAKNVEIALNPIVNPTPNPNPLLFAHFIYIFAPDFKKIHLASIIFSEFFGILGH